MIRLHRSRSKNAIVPSFRVDTQRKRMKELMLEMREKLIAGDEPKLKIKSKWSVTKAQLLIETHDKCAYCESKTTTVAFGDVEHYRPKSIYWWLAYVYDNYLASCGICNQKFKSNIFEFSGPQMNAPVITPNTTDLEIEELANQFTPDPLNPDAVSTFEEMHRLEEPLIPNPYIDEPEEIFAWDVLTGAGQIEVVPNVEHPNSEAIVEACERIYGINRPQLKRDRFDRWVFYNFMLMALEDEGASPALKAHAVAGIKDTTLPNYEYSGMFRYLEKQRLGH